jgi:hypothetical protein
MPQEKDPNEWKKAAAFFGAVIVLGAIGTGIAFGVIEHNNNNKKKREEEEKKLEEKKLLEIKK